MIPAFIMDVDGTLTDWSHRRHLLPPGDFPCPAPPPGSVGAWGTYCNGAVDDAVRQPIRRLHDALCSDGYAALILTGRPESWRAETEAWLARHGIDYEVLLMRANDDSRPDPEVKREMLARVLADGYAPWLAVDDHPGVVEMFGKAGVCGLTVPGPQ